MKNLMMGAILASTLLAGPAFAGGDAAAGKAKGASCFACHGKDGISKMNMYPNLAGQKDKYLVTQLKAFRDGKRASPMMGAPTRGLSDADIDNLAAYFSGLGH